MRTDALAKLATASREDLDRLVPVEHLPKPSVKVDDEEVSPVMSEPIWMDPIWDYLVDGIFPSNPKEASKLTSPWPFQQWGLDILGPLPNRKGQCKFIVVGVDYFAKWAKAELLATITKQKVHNFVWRSIICRFGIPRALVFDNGKQFNNPKFKDFCAELGIKNYYSSPAYPQSNEQAEFNIRTLKAALKTKLENLKGKWVEYFPKLLWAYRTTRKSTTQETPFALAFSTEAVALIEVGLKSPRVEFENIEHNEDILCLNLDFLEEKRD